MKISFASCIAWAFAVSASPTARSFFNVKYIPSTEVNGPIKANFISTAYGLDGPQLSGINSTSWDWWYFDAISPDLKTSICIIFFTAPSTGFPFVDPLDGVTSVGVFYSLPNGTIGFRFINADEAIVITVADGSSAPAHYPCGPAEAGQNMMVGTNIGWSNAIPDAVGVVDFQIGGSALVFTGVGYHDKNWSDQPFQKNVASWYWGHGRLGEYSIVWFDLLDHDGKEYVSAYASKQGEIITVSCHAGSIKVRPSGVNDEYPPTVMSGNPGGFTINLHLGAGSTLNVNVTSESILFEVAPLYTRWAGSMVGNLNGGPAIEGGVALFEEFKLT